MGESGLFTPDDIAYVQEAGVKAVSFSYLDSWLPLLHQPWNLRFFYVVSAGSRWRVDCETERPDEGNSRAFWQRYFCLKLLGNLKLLYVEQVLIPIWL